MGTYSARLKTHLNLINGDSPDSKKDIYLYLSIILYLYVLV